MGRKIILHKLHFLSPEARKYNNLDVEVEVTSEYRNGCFHVIFPCGLRSDRFGEDRGRIIALDGNNNYAPLWTDIIEYGQTYTYPFKLEKEDLNTITDLTNRSNGQTLFLFQLVGGNIDRLMLLELKIKEHFIPYCPSTKEEVEAIMEMTPKTNL